MDDTLILFSPFVSQNIARPWKWSNWLLLLLLVSGGTFANSITSTINKAGPSDWTISYQVDEPIRKIAFKRNPDTSRVIRWLPLDSGFQIVAENNEEFIVRIDGSEFSQVDVSLTANYRHLAKDYAPFSPFSDGGTLIHSGRFFACIETCYDSSKEWRFTLTVPEDEHIIIDGKMVASKTSWIDSNSGRNIYVGKQLPIEANGFLALIDTGLPEKLGEHLLRDIPKMTAFFETRLGKLSSETRPIIFASYSKRPGSSVQGGVLPGQIFIHWDKDNLEKSLADDDFISDLLWTMAHEVGHYFQRFNRFSIKPNESWIHEGHAELLAYEVLRNLYPTTDTYVKTKTNKFEKDCADVLATTTLENAAMNGNFHAHYTCGFLIHRLVSNGFQNNIEQSASPYAVWKLFSSKLEPRAVGISGAASSNKDVFFQSVTQLTHEILTERIKNFINLRHTNAARAVKIFVQQLPAES